MGAKFFKILIPEFPLHSRRLLPKLQLQFCLLNFGGEVKDGEKRGE
ncbi:hypothetical protein SLEP1_g50433 [Rubroshorea leprosula]|uniref:Uncharacterized protein n=1 Tax=Rubroshorea leprosula TaxID=152421 RepID=A0AAV5M080_9ROSI|nr:hypothetical protein SLEP1_g50433 [Rubroshorea leprosula]